MKSVSSPESSIGLWPQLLQLHERAVPYHPALDFAVYNTRCAPRGAAARLEHDIDVIAQIGSQHFIDIQRAAAAV